MNPSMSLLAVDPGKHHCGMALFLEHRLFAVAAIRPEPATSYNVAVMAAEWLKRQARKDPRVLTPSGKVGTLVVEAQVIYPGVRNNDPNDLLPLAYVSGGIHARIDALNHLWVKPGEWIPSKAPKEVRQRRFLGTLPDEDLDLLRAVDCPKKFLSDVCDAMHIGYVILGRVRKEYEGNTQ